MSASIEVVGRGVVDVRELLVHPEHQLSVGVQYGYGISAICQSYTGDAQVFLVFPLRMTNSLLCVDSDEVSSATVPREADSEAKREVLGEVERHVGSERQRVPAGSGDRAWGWQRDVLLQVLLCRTQRPQIPICFRMILQPQY